MALQVRVGDVGVVIRLTIERSGTAVSLVGAGSKTIKVYDPNGTLAETLTGSFYTDGSDGIVQGTTTSSSFTSSGLWRAVAYIGSLSSFSGHTSAVTIDVRPVAT